MSKLITVITLAVNRTRLLKRCIRAVRNQSISPKIEHIIYSEYFDYLYSHKDLEELKDEVQWRECTNNFIGKDRVKRIADLRNNILQDINTPYCAFVDDDNEVEKNHFESLLNSLTDGNYDLAHSWRKLVETDGSPFTGNRYPWHSEAETAHKQYLWCLENNVIAPGSDIIQDGFIKSNSEYNVSTVDMNEWLFKTSVLQDVGFDTSFTDNEIANNVGEDDKLVKKLLSRNIRVVSTRKPTLIYYLGGFSNNF